MNRMIKKNLRFAFFKSIPVMCGYIFLGIAFGILLQTAGYNALWALAISAFVYAGSMQFVMVPMLLGNVSLWTMALTTVLVNSRHIFYGLTFVESFQKMKTKIYMIFSLSDETYSVLCACKNMDPDEKHRDAWFFISALDQLYWIAGSVIGAILGQTLPIDFSGIDFAMTALFVVILIEQILGKAVQTKVAALTGGVVSLISLVILGANRFLMPALLVTVFILSGYSLYCKADTSKIQ